MVSWCSVVLSWGLTFEYCTKLGELLSSQLETLCLLISFWRWHRSPVTWWGMRQLERYFPSRLGCPGCWSRIFQLDVSEPSVIYWSWWVLPGLFLRKEGPSKSSSHTSSSCGRVRSLKIPSPPSQPWALQVSQTLPSLSICSLWTYRVPSYSLGSVKA